MADIRLFLGIHWRRLLPRKCAVSLFTHVPGFRLELLMGVVLLGTLVAYESALSHDVQQLFRHHELDGKTGFQFAHLFFLCSWLVNGFKCRI